MSPVQNVNEVACPDQRGNVTESSLIAIEASLCRHLPSDPSAACPLAEDARLRDRQIEKGDLYA